jgi:hypothetical protein
LETLQPVVAWAFVSCVFSNLFHLPFRTLLNLELCLAQGDGLTSGGEADLDVSQSDACDAGDLVTSGSPWLSAHS